MADRYDVLPHHLLRTLLADRFVRDVLAELGADPDDVRVTLDHEWLAASDKGFRVLEPAARATDPTVVEVRGAPATSLETW